MIRFNFFFLSAVFLLLTGCQPEPVEMTELSDRYSIIHKDGYRIGNNIWNPGDLTDYNQSVFAPTDPSLLTPFGWKYSWPTSHGSVVSYPMVFTGHRPWSNSSTRSDLPVEISRVRSLKVTFDVTTQTNGRHNLAFDIWITSADPSQIQHEVMIWLDWEGMVPGSRPVSDSPYLNGKTTDFHGQTGDSYLAFLIDQASKTGQLDLMAYINYLVSGGYISENDYIASIELGNEVISGEGHTEINAYDVDVQLF